MSFSTVSTSKTRDQFPLSRKKITKKSIGMTLIILIITSVFGGPLLGFAIAGMLAILIKTPLLIFVLWPLVSLIWIFLIYMLVHKYQTWYFNVYFYDLTPDYIVIKKGVFTPKEINIPYERVQDVYVDQDIIDRFFGLYDVHISSATITSGMAAHIDGVEKAAAEGLRETLLTSVQGKIRNIPAAATSATPTPTSVPQKY